MIESSFGLPQLMLIVFVVGAAGIVYVAWRRRRPVLLLAILPLILVVTLPGRGAPPASEAVIISLQGREVVISRETVSQGDHFVSVSGGRFELVRPTGPETGRGTWAVIINDSDRLLTIKVYSYYPAGLEVYVEPEVVGFVRPAEVWWTSRGINFSGGGPPPSSMEMPLGAGSRVFNLEIETEPYDAAAAPMSEQELAEFRARIRAYELLELREVCGQDC